jgi:hypothetical protein
MERRLERWVTRSASAVLVTSEATRADMLSAYPELAPEDIWVVRNGYPAFDEHGRPPSPQEPLRLLHAGSVPGETDVGPLLRGVKQVADRNPGRIQLQLVGPPTPWEAVTQRHAGFEFASVDGLVSPAEARADMTRSSANIVLVPSVQRNQHVAAKLMEYLGAGRPIVGVVSKDSEMAQLGHEYGDMRLVDPYTETGVAAAVERLLIEHEAGTLQAAPHGTNGLGELSRATQIEQLAVRLNDLVTRDQ